MLARILEVLISIFLVLLIISLIVPFGFTGLPLIIAMTLITLIFGRETYSEARESRSIGRPRKFAILGPILVTGVAYGLFLSSSVVHADSLQSVSLALFIIGAGLSLARYLWWQKAKMRLGAAKQRVE